jgi:hypothetical protein
MERGYRINYSSHFNKARKSPDPLRRIRFLLGNPCAFCVISANSKAAPTRNTGAKRERTHSSYSFLASAIDGGEWSASRRFRAFTRGKDLGTHWIGGWVGLRTALDTEARVKILSLCQYRTPVVQSVVRHYTDSYPSSSVIKEDIYITDKCWLR